MTRFLIKCAILLGGLYATGLALWHIGCTILFVQGAVCKPGIVEDVKERPFEDVVEMLEHGNLPWEGDTAYQPFVRYELYGNSILDDKLPDLDNRNYTNGQAVEIILDPRNTHHRHLNSAKFLWGGDLILLALGALLLLISRWLWRRRKKTARQAPPAQAKAAAPRRSAPQPPPQSPEPAPAPAPPPAPANEPTQDLVLTAEPPAPRKRRKKADSSGASGSRASKSSTAKSGGSGAKSTTRTRKSAATATDAAAKPKTTRRRKKAQETA